MKLTLDQLRDLVALAEEGSFTRAAERVYLTQPALSVQIRKLEEALGTRLFDRRKGTLTEAGRFFCRMLFTAGRAAKRPENCEIWYDGRR